MKSLSIIEKELVKLVKGKSLHQLFITGCAMVAVVFNSMGMNISSVMIVQITGSMLLFVGKYLDAKVEVILHEVK